MSEYFIPLRTLVPKILGVPLDSLPFIGPISDNIGVRNLHEAWNDTQLTMTGEGVIEKELSVDVFGMTVVAGHGDSGDTFRFEYTTDRTSLLQFLGEMAADSLGLEDGEEPDSDDIAEQTEAELDVDFSVDDAEDPALLIEGLPTSFRVVIRDLGLRLRLPAEHLQLGELIDADGNVVASDSGRVASIQAKPGDEPIEIELPSAILTFKSPDQLSIELENDQALDIPPLLIRDAGWGFEVDQARLDLSATEGFPEVLARPGFDEAWKGLYLEKLRVFGLNNVLPFLPSRVDPETDSALGVIELSQWLIGNEGLTGSLDIRFADPDDDALWKLGELGIELDHGELVRGTIGSTFRIGMLGENNDFASIGPDGDLLVAITLRHYRALSGPEAWGFDLAVRTPGVTDGGLLRIKRELITAMQAGLAPALIAAATAGGWKLGLTAAILNVLVILDRAFGAVTIEEIQLDGITGRTFVRPVAGKNVRYLDISLDLQTRVSLKIPQAALLGLIAIETDRPAGVAIQGLGLRWALDRQGLDDATVPPFEVLWEPDQLIIDVGESTVLTLGMMFQIFRLGFGRWDGGIWLDLGMRVAADNGDLAIDVMPSAVRIYFRSDGEVDRVEFQGATFSLLVPYVVWARGEINVGDVSLIEGRGMFCGNGTASPENLDSHKHRSAWLWDLSVGIREEQLASGASSLVVSADVSTSKGIPLCPSVSIFGFFGHFANNARAALSGGTWAEWYRDRAPRNQITASKFEGSEGSWGFGVGTTLGSPEGGRLWNAKVGLMIQLPGPALILTGSGQPLAPQIPSLKSEASAAFSAVLALDFDNEIFSLDLKVEYKAPGDSGGIVHISIPIEIYVETGGDSTRWHIYFGEHWPVEERILARIISLFELSAYLMIDGSTIENLANKGRDIPGTAIALGAAGRYDWGVKSRFLKIYLYAGAEFHIALGVPDPLVFFGFIGLEGGIVFKVFGFGFELGLWAHALGFAAPSGRCFEGEFGVRVGLPWPLPDIKLTVPFKIGDTPTLPDPELTVGLSLHPREANRPRELSASGVNGNIPVDPTFSLTFNFPVRNETAALDSFRFDSSNNSTYHVASGGNGYRFTLKELRLWKGDADTGELIQTTIPALWVPGQPTGPGGQPGRRSLELFNFGGLQSSRYYGPSAGYLDGVLGDTDPCADSRKPPAPVCYLFHEEATGPAAPRRFLEVSRRPDLHVEIVEPSAEGDSLRRLFGLGAADASVVLTQIPAPQVPVDRVLQLPGIIVPSEGGTISAGAILASRVQHVDLRLHAPAGRIEIDIVRWASDVVEIRFFRGREQVHATRTGALIERLSHSHQPPSHVGDLLHGWVHLRYGSPVVADRVEIHSAYASDIKSGASRRAYLLRVCTLDEAAVLAHQDDVNSAAAFEDFWSDLIQQEAGTSDALLLDPGARYTLEADIEWGIVQVDEGADPSRPDQVAPTSEVKTGRTRQTFALQTTEQSPERLRGRESSIDERVRLWDPEHEPFGANLAGYVDDWDVAVSPSPQRQGVYTGRPLRLAFRDARTDILYEKFEERLFLRLVDETGEDLFERLDWLKERARALPEYEEIWREYIEGRACAPDDAGDLWSFGSALFSTVLKENIWYDARLTKVPVSAIPTNADSAPMLDRIDWDSHPTVYQWRFKTSRWLDMNAHLAAFDVLDICTEGEPDLASIPAHTRGVRAGRVVGDQVLDGVLLDALQLPLTPPAQTPELIRIWRPDNNAGDSYSLIGLLVDSPEPLIRESNDVSLTRTAPAQAPVETLVVQGASRARTLLLFPNGGGFQSLPEGELELTVREPWIQNDGTQTRETASRAVSIPPLPPHLAEEVEESVVFN